MKIGDLVRLLSHMGSSAGKLFLVTNVYGTTGLCSLCGFPSNQVFREDQLEVVSESR